jgi:inorganic triphosphatase YgiF
VSGVTPPTTALRAPHAVSAGVEIERQWRASAGLRLPAAIGPWHVVSERHQRLVDHYYDTADLQLAEQRARLRVRHVDAVAFATLKRRVPSGGRLRRRIEIEGPCQGDPEASVAFVAARLLTLHPLGQIGRIATARTARLYVCGERAVEVASDRVSYPVGDDEWRVEAEGAADDVNEIGRLLEQLSLGLGRVRRGKVQTLLRRCAA